MRTISKRTIRKYMTVFVNLARENGNTNFKLSRNEFDSLRGRSDFRTVIQHLKALGLIVCTPDLHDAPVLVRLTDSGLRYFEDSKDAISEMRWTRGLSIASIIVSIFAVCIAGLSLYLQFRSGSP